MLVSEERVAALEARTARLEEHVAWLDGTVEAPPPAPARPAPRAESARPAETARPAATARPVATARPAATARRAATADSAARFEELVGGRVLGWVGGLAVLVGLLFFLVVAASRGWIGEELRVVMASAASVLLLCAGARSQERRGRSDAALAAAATGIAGLFATIVVAGPVYDLLPAAPALVLALAVGALATVLALRWSAAGIGWLGILGALVSPALVGAATDNAGIALMLVAYAAAGAIMLWQRWHALAGAAFVIAVPQLAWWMIDWSYGPGPSSAAVVAALVGFGIVTAASAAGFEWRTGTAKLRVSAHVLLCLNALALAGLGAGGLEEGGLDLWLAALALAHLGAGLLARRSRRVSRELALAAAGLGIVLADVAFATVADGLPLVLGWAAGAVAFSALARRARHRSDSAFALAGLGGHLLLAVATALTRSDPLTAVAGGAGDQAAALTALAALSAASWAAARLVAPRLPHWRLALDATALAALALLSAVALDGVALTLALAGEAIALAALARRERRAATGRAGGERRNDATIAPAAGGERAEPRATTGPAAADPLPFAAALAFTAVALGHALTALAPPAALIAGLDRPLPAALGLAAVIAATAFAARAAVDPRVRTGLDAGAAVLGLYLASALLVTPFQPGAEFAALPLTELDVRQQGQALLSAMWALAGVVALVVGLTRDERALRIGALALLTVTAAKVFAFDLASLTSLYRVGSCIALGLLLLAGAFAWQRIRPELRGVPGAVR